MSRQKKLQKAAEWLASFSEPTRLMIVMHLSSGQKNVTEIARACDTEIVNISHHLGVMRNVGLVEAQKDGRFMHYSLIGGEMVKEGLKIKHESGIFVVIPT